MKKSDSWRAKLSKLLFGFQREVVRTSNIGKKLLTAGRTNAHLKDTYENLGRVLESKVDRGEIDIDDPKIKSLLHTIKACKKDLKELEDQVNKIKFSPSPEDISEKLPVKKDD